MSSHAACGAVVVDGAAGSSTAAAFSGRDLQRGGRILVRHSAAASRSCVCEDNKTEGGCGRQLMCRAGPAEARRAAGPDEAVVRAGGAVAAGPEVRRGGDERPGKAERLEHRPAGRGPDAGPDAAAAERACWDTFAVMGVVRRFAWPASMMPPGGPAGGGACGSGRWMSPGRRRRASPRRGQEAVHGVRGQGGERHQHRALVVCAGEDRHALIGARQWIPAEHIADPVKSQVMACRRTWCSHQGTAGHHHLRGRVRGRVRLDFACGDEVYGSCTGLREFLEDRGRATCCGCPRTFTSPWPAGSPSPARRPSGRCCRHAPLGSPLRRERIEGRAVVRLGVAGPPRPRGTTCWSAATSRRVSWPFTTVTCPKGRYSPWPGWSGAAGLRWPVEEDFEFGKDCFGLDQSQSGFTPRSPGTPCECVRFPV